MFPAHEWWSRESCFHRVRAVKQRCRDALKRQRHRESTTRVPSSILVLERSWSWTVLLILGFLWFFLSLHKLPSCLILLAIKLDLINLETSQKLSWECIKIKRPKSKLVERNPNRTWVSFAELLLDLWINNLKLCISQICWGNFPDNLCDLFCTNPSRNHSVINIFIPFLKQTMYVLGLVWPWPCTRCLICISFLLLSPFLHMKCVFL